MINAANLKSRTVKELTELARKRKVLGWHDMRKDELVQALLRLAKKSAVKRNGAKSATTVVAKNGLSKNDQSKNGFARNGSAVVAEKAKAGSGVAGSGVAGSGVAGSGVKVSNGVKLNNGVGLSSDVKSNGSNGAKSNGVKGNGGVESSNGHSTNGCQAKNGATSVLAKSPVSTSTLPANGSAALLQSPAPLTSSEKQALLESKKLIERAPKPRSPSAERRLQQIKARLAEAKDLAIHGVEDDQHAKDRLVVMVRDPYWLHAYWELSRRSVRRAEVAMGPHWHAARPVLRLNEVSRNGTTSAARKTVRDIEIHGGVNNWYIDVQNPPRSYQVEIGYLAPGNRFYCLGRSNVVSTPMPGSSDTFDRNWAEVAKECDRVYAMTAGSTEQEANGDLKDVFEEHMHRPMGDSLLTQFGPGAGVSRQDFRFQIETELIVHGVTQPDARVTLRGEPVRLRPDGSFAVRFSLPDRRHVLPVVANSGDGAEQRTIVLAIDRNTKVMEPVLRDPGE